MNKNITSSEQELPAANDELGANTTTAGLRSQRLPLRSVTFNPTKELRMRILEIAQKTGRTYKEVTNNLISQAADIKIPWLVIRPRNEAGAAVSLKDVSEALEKTFVALRDSKGIVARHGSDQQRTKVDAVLSECLELWAAAQRLAADTIFDLETLAAGREIYASYREHIPKLERQLKDEKAKTPNIDAEAIRRLETQLNRYKKFAAFIVRVGLAGDDLMP